MPYLQLLTAYCFLFMMSPVYGQDNASEQSSVVEDSSICTRLFRNTISAYQELNLIQKSARSLPIALPLAGLMSMHVDECNQSGTMPRIEQALAQHSGKIAILLPFSKFPKAQLQELIKQVQIWLQARGLSSDKTLIWRDSGGSKGQLQSQLAQLVLQEQVAIIIGGLTEQEAPILAQWADRLRIPALLFNRKVEKSRSKYVFHIRPDVTQMAASLSRYAYNRKLQRIAILEPQFTPDKAFLVAFQEQATQVKLQVSGPYIYQGNDFSSIDAVFRKLFHIDDESRKEELLELIKLRREQAEVLSVPFDAKKVMLPPILDIDAIMIADHFKNLRHLSKVLAYYGVKHIQLLGIPRWRAYELIDPPDEYLQGAVFVDYIGSYKQMPYGIQVPLVDSEFFAEGAGAGLADLKLVMHHAIYTALQALAGTGSARFALYRRLESAQGPLQGFFQFPKVFRPDHSAYWPSFLFSLGQSSISLLQTANPIIINSSSSNTQILRARP